MAATALSRSPILSRSSFLSLYNRLFSASKIPTSGALLPFTTTTLSTYRPISTPPIRPFCSSSSHPVNTPKKRNPKLVNFSLSDSESDSENDSAAAATANQTQSTAAKKNEIDKSKLPPPYDPFSKKPAIEDPEDPTNLQEVFHKIRSDGLYNSAVKMFDGLSKDGLTHEALELFGQIKDKGHMPDVVAHTAVIEAYVNAGKAKDALKVYQRMLAAGVRPNAYTYAVVIKGLARSGEGKLVEEARKCMVEMMGKGMRPNAGTCVAVVAGLVREGRADEGGKVVEEMRGRGFLPEETEAREVMREMRGPVVRSVMDMLFAK